MVRQCCVYNCKNNSRDNSKLSFFTIPKDPARQAVWLQAIGRMEWILSDPLVISRADRRVCADHFSRKMFCGVRLKKTAQPDLLEKNLGQHGINVGASTSTASPETVLVLEDDRENTPPNEQGSIKTCRICMEEVADDAKNIFEDNLYDDVPIHLGISDCIYPIKVSIEDPLTKYACTECLEDLCSFVKFRNVVIRNDKIQRDRIDGIDPLIINNEADSKKRKTEEDNECHQKKKKKKINGLELTPCPTQRMSFAVVDVDEEGTVIVKNRIKQSNEKSNHLIVEREDELSNSIQDSTLQVNNSSPNTDVNIYFCMVNGYLMEHKFSKENTRYYKCALSKCPALAKQELHVPGLSKKTFILIQPHKHEKPTELEIKKQKIISVVRKKLQITKGSTIKSIYDDVSKLDPAVAELLPMKALMSEICNL